MPLFSRLAKPTLLVLACASLGSAATLPPSDPTLPAALNPKSLPVVAVFPFQSIGVDSTQSLVLSETLSYELMKTGRVRVLERSQIQAILAEQGFGQSGVCDATECAVQVGRLLGVERVVVGSIGKLGGTHALNLRQVAIATGEVVSISSQRLNGGLEAVLERAIPLAAQELFPGSNAAPQKSVVATPAAKANEIVDVKPYVPHELQLGTEGMVFQGPDYGGLALGLRLRLWWPTVVGGFDFGVGGWYASQFDRRDVYNSWYGPYAGSSVEAIGLSVGMRRGFRFSEDWSGMAVLEYTAARFLINKLDYMDVGDVWEHMPALFFGVSRRLSPHLSVGGGYGVGLVAWEPTHKLELSTTLHWN